jgi:hypothetical protein
MSRALPKFHRRRVVAFGAAGGTLSATVAARAGTADRNPQSGSRAAATGSGIVLPPVDGTLPQVPPQTQAEVNRHLALPQTQIDTAGKRSATSAGQPEPEAVRNAVAGPLQDKRKSTIDRIVPSISRQGATAPSGLDALAGCSLS